MTESSASSHAALSSSRTAKEGLRPELGGGAGREWGHEASHTAAHPLPIRCPGTHTLYSHRALLLKALPMGSTGGPGRQDVEEDTHLAGIGEA